MNSKKSAILQELESDDELPDVYNDATILPSYLIDNRFDDIKFAWIDAKNQIVANESSNTNNYGEMKLGSKIHVKGILKHQDLYCLKAIETLTCNNTLIWFANFLMHKDLQSHYKFLRSCLVNDLMQSVPLNKRHYANELGANDTKLEIVIK